MCFCFFFNEHKHTFEHHSKSFGNEWVEYGCRGESGPVPLYGTLLGQMPPCRSRLRGPMVTAQGRGGKTSLGDALGAGRCLMTTGVESAPGLNLRTGGGTGPGLLQQPPLKLEKNPPPCENEVLHQATEVFACWQKFSRISAHGLEMHSGPQPAKVFALCLRSICTCSEKFCILFLLNEFHKWKRKKSVLAGV